MALAASLIPGFTYMVNAGPYTGAHIKIVDNKAFPDFDENGNPHPDARKITATLAGDTIYIIPRLVNGTPIADPMFTGVAASVATAGVTTVEPLVNFDAAADYTATIQPMGQMTESASITDPMDPRLDHLRPNTRKVMQYVNRIMPNGMTDVQFFLQLTDVAHREENQGRPANFMLRGDTQGGKTFLVEALAVAWAKLLKLPKPMPIFTISGSAGVTDFDLFGQQSNYCDYETGTDRIVWLPGMVDMAARVGGILYVDECNALSERVTTSIHPLADHRHMFINRNKPVKVPGDGFMPEMVTGSMNLWIIGTFNEGYRGMGEMNEAFLNRFRHFEWGYDEKVERQLVASPTIHLLADALRTSRSEGKGIRTPVGTAALQRLQLDIATFGVDAALQIFVAPFKSQERTLVREIIDGRSIKILLVEELKGDQ